jgi:hypothetical protein
MRPGAPKKMKKLAKRTHALSDLLGDDHDLAELRRSVERHPDRFDDRAGQLALLAVIDRRRNALQQQAFASGRELYRSKPTRFVEAIYRRWRRRARPPVPAAQQISERGASRCPTNPQAARSTAHGAPRAGQPMVGTRPSLNATTAT